MPNKLIIDKSPFYTRCAVLIDGEPHEIHIMPVGEESVEGNIFAGRIETISKGIDAAFVNIGQRDNAFLYVDEKNDFDKLKNGQSVIVQALRDATKGKGVYVTTNISFAGTYIVLFPDGNDAHVGVSAKITDKDERKRLIELVRPYTPKGVSVVIRTSAYGKTREIIKDLKLVIRKMEATLSCADSIKPPALIYEEKHFLEKILRDTLSYKPQEIIVNSEMEYNKLLPVAESLKIPLACYREAPSAPTLFDYYEMEGKVRNILHNRVWLKGGGFLIIDETEALVSIDVNTGRSKKREKTGETLFFSNLEAAVEIPRQLRLRNLSGIIVIDFIDMKSDEKREQVLQTLKEECLKDRIKTTVVGFTELGLALITRKKTRKPISRTLLSSCDCIGGRRYSETYIAFNIYLKIKSAALNSAKKQARVHASNGILKSLQPGIEELGGVYGVTVETVESEFSEYGKHVIEF